MPNWVYSSVNITGKTEDLKNFITKSTRPRPYEDKMGEEEFSFWNFVAPPQDIVDSGEYFGVRGFIDGEEKGNTENNWYEWNCREWGTKWDACDAYIELDKGETSITLSYSTAWSIPEPAMGAMVEQHPELRFEFWCEEEQGWGANFVGENGELSETESWDIPNSHSDYVARDREDSCICSFYDDEEDWYEDCPRTDGSGETIQVLTEKQMLADLERFAEQPKPED